MLLWNEVVALISHSMNKSKSYKLRFSIDVTLNYAMFNPQREPSSRGRVIASRRGLDFGVKSSSILFILPRTGQP